jgi:hypothetical protein
MEKKDTRARTCLRLIGINGDQSKVDAPTRTVALLNPDTARALDGVTATIRMVTAERYRELEKECRVPDKGLGGKVEWTVDMEALQLAILTEALESWTGVVGADNTPLPISGAVLKALDPFNRTHRAGGRATPAEVIDAAVVAASFREPRPGADVAG